MISADSGAKVTVRSQEPLVVTKKIGFHVSKDRFCTKFNIVKEFAKDNKSGLRFGRGSLVLFECFRWRFSESPYSSSINYICMGDSCHTTHHTSTSLGMAHCGLKILIEIFT